MDVGPISNSVSPVYIIVQCVILIILIVLSAVCSSMETAFMSVNGIRMRALSEEGNKKASRVLQVLDQKEKMLTAILICNNVVNLTASAVASLLADKIFGNLGVTLATLVLTLLILIFGEISPKTYASLHADKFALKMGGFVSGLMTVLTPIIFIVSKISRGFLRLMRVNPDVQDGGMTEEELRVILDVSHESGVIEKEETEMIKNVVDFGDVRAKDVMIPRIDMTFVQVDMSFDEIMDVFKEDMFTRMPVYGESKDEVLGIINMKDILLYDREKPFKVSDFMRDAYFTIESKHTSELLVEMRKESQAIAIVLDEYGATSGMVTLEDLIEEIIGEIRDEFDEAELEQIKRLSKEVYLIDASMKLTDINDVLGTSFESEEYDSLGGFVMEKLDHIPEEKEMVEWNQVRLTVAKTDKNRMDKIRLQFLKKKIEEPASEMD